MRLKLPAHPLIYGVVFVPIVIASMALDAVDPLATRHAEAQAQPTAVSTEGDMTVPDGGYILGPDGRKVPVEPSPVSATPAVPLDAGNDMMTSLGGSDVAVSSVGGSHEIDGPKRKGRRFPAPTPNP